MSENSSKQYKRWLLGGIQAAAVTVWVILAFMLASLLIAGTVYVLEKIGIAVFSGLSQSVSLTVQAAILYVLTFTIALFGSRFVSGKQTTKKDVGLQRLPSWTDMLFGPLAFIPYIIATGFVAFLATKYLPGFDANQVQDIGFETVSNRTGYIVAFVTLVVIAPIAEEAIFRGYLYQKVRKATNVFVAILLTSLAFAFVHGQLNVGLDVFILSIFLCGLRELTGSIWAGILLHMTKNALAYYVLFLLPMF
jgi:membrane protease YdiL (CAAX protease family)